MNLGVFARATALSVCFASAWAATAAPTIFTVQASIETIPGYDPFPEPSPLVAEFVYDEDRPIVDGDRKLFLLAYPPLSFPEDQLGLISFTITVGETTWTEASIAGDFPIFALVFENDGGATGDFLGVTGQLATPLGPTGSRTFASNGGYIEFVDEFELAANEFLLVSLLEGINTASVGLGRWDVGSGGGGGTPAIPEPASWAMMITGFGIVGLAARRRRIVACA